LLTVTRASARSPPGHCPGRPCVAMIAATISGGLLLRQSQLSSDEKATEVFVLEAVL
jgi:hypothetical protein